MQESDTDWSKVDFTDFVASSSALLQFFNYFSFVPDQQHYVDEFGLDILPFIFRSIKKAFYALSPDGLDYLAVESKALEVCRNFLALSNSRECIISVHNALEDLNNEFSMNDQIDPTAIDNHFPLRHLIFVLLIGLDTLGKLQSTKKHLFYEDFLNSWNKLFTKLQIFSINFPMSTFFERSIEETWASLLSDHEGYTFIFSLLHSLLTLSQSATPFPVYLQKLLVEFIKQLEAKAKEYPLLIASLSNSSIHFKDETCHIVLNSLLGSTKPINWHYAYFFLQQKNPIDLRPVLPSLSHCISILCWEQNLRNALFKEVLTPWLNTLPPGNLEPVLIELLEFHSCMYSIPYPIRRSKPCIHVFD
ncbi:hypothetical protein HMI55_005876 [Coelomomyces lativittatus]|nr:hypothetical protein HMI55_005876 [Coelomomyces lativittatus]